MATSRYLGVSAGGRTLAALSAHWAPQEIDPADAARQLALLIRGAAGIRNTPWWWPYLGTEDVDLVLGAGVHLPARSYLTPATLSDDRRWHRPALMPTAQNGKPHTKFVVVPVRESASRRA